jgi:hypothetical protein
MWVGQIFMSYEITYNSFYNFLIHFFEVIAFVLLGISVLLLPKEALPKPIGLLGSGGWFALVFVCLGEFLLYSPQFRLVDSIFSYQKILSVLFLLLRISSAVLTALTFVAILFIRKRDFSRSANVTGEGRAPFGQARGLPGECGGR